MELRLALAPLYLAAIFGLAVAAIAWRTRSLPRWPGAAAACAAVAMTWAVSEPGQGPGAWLSGKAATMVVGLALAAAAAALAALGNRQRRCAELMLSTAPVPIDEGAREARQARRPRPGLYRGRLATAEPVSSPGGVVSAFYEAEVRRKTGDGTRGSLLTRDRSSAPDVALRGERVEVAVDLGRSELLGPVRPRECRVTPVDGLALLRQAERGEPPADAVSLERVGKVGARCLIAGQLDPGPAGQLRLHAPAGSPALVVLEGDGLAYGRSFRWKAWALFAASAAVCAASAACLAA